jgi:hypothetical protein
VDGEVAELSGASWSRRGRLVLESVETSPGEFSTRATVRKLGVYLDNYALIDIAKGPPALRQRVIDAFHHGADLMFSPTSAAEILGPQCSSSIDAIRSFLDDIGPHWFPLEGFEVSRVIALEGAGARPGEACLSEWFLRLFSAAHSLHLHGEQRLGFVGPEFFRLGFILDWLRPHRDDILRRLGDGEKQVQTTLRQFRQAYEQNRRGFDLVLPPPKLDPSRPATYLWAGLLRTLVLEAKASPFKKGDAADFFHAIMGSAYAHYALLDKHWKRRVVSLRGSASMARIYYRPELEAFVDDLEAATAR